ncbi:MAG: TonB family protein [Elusimicrobiota bacterium]
MSANTFYPFSHTVDPYFRRMLTYSIASHLIFFFGILFYQQIIKNKTTVSKPYLFTMVNVSSPRPLRATRVTPSLDTKPVPVKETKPTPMQPIEQKVIQRKADVKKEKASERPTPAPSQTKPAQYPMSSLVSQQEVTVDNPSFRYSYFQNAIIMAIGRNWNPPKELLLDDEEKEVIVFFTVNRDGSILDIELSESSWNNILDRMAIRAVELAKLPPLPNGFNDNFIKIKYHFKLVRE